MCFSKRNNKKRNLSEKMSSRKKKGRVEEKMEWKEDV